MPPKVALQRPPQKKLNKGLQFDFDRAIIIYQTRVLDEFCFQFVVLRIIELLHTNRHRELLSVGSEVQILLWTPVNNAESLCFQGFSAFLI